MNLINITRWLALGSYFALLILLMLWFSVLAPSVRVPTSLMLLIMVGPLLFPLRGILYGKAYTHAWTSMLVLIYFLHGAVEAYANPDERIYALLEVLFSGSLFVSSMFYARLQGKAQKKQPPQQTEQAQNSDA